MGFKLPGKSITSGTSAHSSALKMKAEADASALKQKAKTYEEAFEELDIKFDETLGSNEWTRKDKYGREYGRKGGQEEFTKAAKAWNMKTYGTHNPTADAKKAGMTKKELAAKHKASKTTTTPSTTTKPEVTTKKKKKTIEEKGEIKKTKIQTKADIKKSEVDENVSVKEAKSRRKYARKTFGRGSAEHAQTKAEVSKAKGEDMAAAKGGKKAVLFGNLRRKLNKIRTENLEKKAIKKGKEKDASE